MLAASNTMQNQSTLILVLLPGIDDTSELFKPFLQHYEGQFQIVALPEHGP